MGDLPALVPVPKGDYGIPVRSPQIEHRQIHPSPQRPSADSEGDLDALPPHSADLHLVLPQGDPDGSSAIAPLVAELAATLTRHGLPAHRLTVERRSPRLSLVIPTYEEADNIDATLRHIITVLDGEAFTDAGDPIPGIPGDYELIVVDDNSLDKTWKIAQALSAEFPQIRVMCRHYEEGLSTAVLRGWQVARGEILGAIDGDGQHDERILPQLVGAIAAGADLAIASRNESGGGVSDWNLWRRIASRGAQLVGLVILPEVVSRVSDPMSGFFLVRRRAIAGRPLDPIGYKVLLEVLGRGQVGAIAAVGYEFRERQRGESKVGLQHFADYIAHLIRLRRARWPLKRFSRFAIVGLSGVFVDMAVLFILSDPTMLAWGLTRSKVIAAEVAIFNNFIWNDRWTFGDIARRQRGRRRWLKRFLKFNAVCLLGLVLNVAILNVLFNQVFDHQHRYWANAIAILCVTLWNFWLNTKLSWRVTERR